VVSASGPDAAAGRSGRRARAAILLLGAAVLLFASRARETPATPAQLDLDQAWKVTLADRLEQGEVAGRDFFYTYGPGAQLLAWLASRAHRSHDPLAAVPLVDLLFVAINLLLVVAILWRLDLGVGGTALALLVLSAARIPEHYASFRALLVVLAALAAGEALAEPRRGRRLALGAAAGGVVALAQLVSADLLPLGALAVAGTIALWVLQVVLADRRRGFLVGASLRAIAPPALAVAAASAGAVLAANLALAAFCAPVAGWSGYHRELASMVTGYGLAMGHGWALDSGRTIALFCGSVLLAMTAVRRAGAAAAAERATLLALLAASVVSARSAFTRSDLGHIALGFTPAMVLLSVLVALELRHTRRLAAPTLLLTFALLAGWPFSDLGGVARALGAPVRFDQVRDRTRALRSDEVERAPLLRRAAPARGVRSRLAAVRVELGKQPLAAVPWESHLATALGVPPAGAILQAYAAHTPEAQERYLAALRGEPSTRVLLAVDHLGTRPLDGVLTAARLPVLQRGLLEELEPAAPADRAGTPFLLLRRRAQARRLRAERVEVAQPVARVRGEVRIELGPTPCRLLEVELVLDYPPWLALGSAEPIELEVREAGAAGPIVTTRVVPLREGAPFSVLVPLISMRRFAELWEDPAPPGPTVAELRLRRVAEPLAASPGRSEVRGVSCLEW
jgi:hypothetical protein